MNLYAVAAMQLITESQKDSVMLEELFSDQTGLTSLIGKQVKSHKKSFIINYILLKFHGNNLEGFIRFSYPFTRLCPISIPPGFLMFSWGIESGHCCKKD